MITTSIRRGTLVLAALVAAAGCKASKPAQAAPGAVSFSAVVSTAFELHGCTACHGGEGGLSLTSHRVLMAGGRSGKVVVPGDGAGSLLVKKLRGTAPGERMPLGGTPIPSPQIDAISAWIDQGALDN